MEQKVTRYPHIAFVVQRCGSNIYAGAERNALKMATAVAELGCKVRIYTSQSDSYRTWANNLPPEENIDENVKILRFPTIFKRRRILFTIVKRIAFFMMKLNRPLYDRFADKIDLWFLQLQGPWCPTLWDALKADEDKFDCVVVNSYLYAPTFFSLKTINSKKLFVVTAHDEGEFYMNFVGEEVAKADALGFLSLAEKALCENVWPVARSKQSLIVPPGIDALCQNSTPPAQAGLPEKFFLYLGRIDRNKGIEELYRLVPSDVRVVLAGHIMWPFKPDPRFVFLGPVTEAEKKWLYKTAIALLVASRKESYSIVTADAISENCAVIALAGCGPVDELVERYGGLVVAEHKYSQILEQFWERPADVKNLTIQSELIKREKSWSGSAQKIYQWALQQ